MHYLLIDMHTVGAVSSLHSSRSRHLEIFELVRIEDEKELASRLETVSVNVYTIVVL